MAGEQASSGGTADALHNGAAFHVVSLFCTKMVK